MNFLEAITRLEALPEAVISPVVHLYRVDRGTVRVKCLAQEHNVLTPVRARSQTARVQRTVFRLCPSQGPCIIIVQLRSRLSILCLLCRWEKKPGWGPEKSQRIILKRKKGRSLVIALLNHTRAKTPLWNFHSHFNLHDTGETKCICIMSSVLKCHSDFNSSRLPRSIY